MNALATALAETIENDEKSMLGALSELRPKVMEMKYTRKYPAGRMTALLNAIHFRLAPRRESLLFFAGTDGGKGTGLLAFEAAYAAAMQRKDLVLFLDMSQESSGMAQRLKAEVPLTMDEFVVAGGGKVSPFIALRGTRLFYASLSEFGQNIPAPTLHALLDALRHQFGLIVTCSPNALADGSAMTLTKLTDGVVLVLEAERTREPVAAQLKSTIEEQGGTVVGAVLARRRFYIPRFLYSMLYKSSTGEE